MLKTRVRKTNEERARGAVVALQARVRRIFVSKYNVRARMICKCLSLSKTVAAKTESLKDLDAVLHKVKSRALSDRCDGAGYKVFNNKDAFPGEGENAFICEVDLTKPFECFKICNEKSFGGFATFAGKAYFRAQSPDECRGHLKKTHARHGIKFYLRKDDSCEAPAAKPVKSPEIAAKPAKSVQFMSPEIVAKLGLPQFQEIAPFPLKVGMKVFSTERPEWKTPATIKSMIGCEPNGTAVDDGPWTPEYGYTCYLFHKESKEHCDVTIESLRRAE